jgi:hypothetical protein
VALSGPAEERVLIGPAGVVAARDGQTGAFAVISILGMIILRRNWASELSRSPATIHP